MILRKRATRAPIAFTEKSIWIIQLQIIADLNIVALGGGTGLSTLLAGLKCLVGERQVDNAVDCEPVGDCDSVRRRRKFRPFARRVANASARRHPQLHDCAFRRLQSALSSFRYRFRGDGELGGHSFGNLFLAALTEVTGDFTEAVRLSSEVLASKGHIYPGNDQRRAVGCGTGGWRRCSR